MNVIDFFNETWKHTPKPYKYNEYLIKKKKIDDEGNLEAVRDTTIQSTTFTDKNGKICFNTRKITEFPEFLAKLKIAISCSLAAEHMYYNYEFLTGMFCITNTESLFNHGETYRSGSSYQCK